MTTRFSLIIDLLVNVSNFLFLSNATILLSHNRDSIVTLEHRINFDRPNFGSSRPGLLICTRGHRRGGDYWRLVTVSSTTEEKLKPQFQMLYL